ncbi:site-specific integrase [Photobacterium damselae]|uniref:MutL protein n=2 Tax=Photobacterium damselae TaxID=38293 RepID=D0YVT0_PHODD|nr:site-specific integrase [Photobacterium damselae]EEZ40963.1 MutL protein [Photobacterium damselae subsp. damselae CIP 102761]PSW86861.1 site-specific integrase [Photobacterium damselae]SPY28357.1 site-specific tyrosine recombinase XerC [Photobacterium damselae]
MARQRKLVSSEYANGDYTSVTLAVERKPVLEFVHDDNGELKPSIKERINPTMVTIPLLTDPSGALVFPANLYLHHVAQDSVELSTLNTHSQALLLFYRWLRLAGKTIYDCSSEREEGVVYGFRDFLVDNLKRDVVVDGEVTTEGIWEASTAATYVGVIIQFYEFMHVERIIRMSENFIPFEYTTKRIRKRNGKGRKRGVEKVNQHDILGHTKVGDKDFISVNTTGLLKPFKGAKPNASTSHKLTPMREDEKRIFYSYLKLDSNFESASEVKNLMLYLATEVGVRVEELVTFPASEVRYPSPELDTIPVLLSPVKNGCQTKYDKARTIQVPRKVMDALFLYKTSKARVRAESRALVKHNCLFVSHTEGRYYSPNTIEKHFESIRKNIRLTHKDWYFTVHDTRATFATHWLYEQHASRGLIFDMLLTELAELMGHEQTATTQKYIDHMNNDKHWREFAQRKNNYMKALMRNQ